MAGNARSLDELVSLRRKPSLSASKTRTSNLEDQSFLRRLTPTVHRKSLHRVQISTNSIASISECRYCTFTSWSPGNSHLTFFGQVVTSTVSSFTVFLISLILSSTCPLMVVFPSPGQSRSAGSAVLPRPMISQVHMVGLLIHKVLGNILRLIHLRVVIQHEGSLNHSRQSFLSRVIAMHSANLGMNTFVDKKQKSSEKSISTRGVVQLLPDMCRE